VMERSVPIRPGIEDHLVRGAISLFEFGIYVVIHIQADYRTGIWRGSAPRILATAPRGASLRQVQRALEHFESVGYLKSFRVQGARGNTPYLIDKFTVRSGALKGYRINAAKSESWQRPFYELVAEVVTEDDAVPVAEHGALSRSKKERSKKENPAPKPTAPSSTRFRPFFQFAWLPDEPAYVRYWKDVPGQLGAKREVVPLGVFRKRAHALRKAREWLDERGINSTQRFNTAIQRSDFDHHIQAARRMVARIVGTKETQSA